MTRRAICLGLAAVLAATLAAPAQGARGRTVTVMTRNLFLGADLAPLVGTRSIDELSLAAGAIWSRIKANDFPLRARALAAEIAATKPDVVGLQEVSLYRSDRPSDGTATPAETTELDYLRLLIGALRARGVHYRAAATFESPQLEIPVGLPPTIDIRAIDRDAILVRAGAARRGIRVREVVAGQYDASTIVPAAGMLFRAPRDWVQMTLSVRGHRVVVFDTHLDSVVAQVRAAQGRELLERVAPLKAPVVVLGDLNSGPGSDPTVYDALRAGGLGDAWTQVHGGAPGLTCCFAPDLRPTARAFSSRIDLVLTGNGVRATRAQIVGEALSDRIGGLWPSDHAGVVAKLRIP